MRSGLAYIPTGSTKVTDKATGAHVYLYERGGKLAAMGFAPKATANHCGHWTFKTAAAREKWVRELFDGFRAHAKRKAERAQAKKAFCHSLQPGHILTSSWGYEQTNIDFYQVTALIGSHMVEVRKIRRIDVSKDPLYMQGDVMPDIDNFCGEPFRRHVKEGNRLKIESYASASLWDGKPEHFTAYA
jgi:hypothetical protein